MGSSLCGGTPYAARWRVPGRGTLPGWSAVGSALRASSIAVSALPTFCVRLIRGSVTCFVGRLCKRACGAVSGSDTIGRLRLGWGIWLWHQRSLWGSRMQNKPYACGQAGLCGASSLAEQRPVRLCSGHALRRPPGRRMPDGWTRQRPRTAVPKRLQDYRHGVSVRVVLWGSWFNIWKFFSVVAS